MAGDLEHPEAADVIALVQGAVDVPAGPREDAREELVHRVVGLALADHLRVLRQRDVGLAHPVGDAELLADRIARALMVDVRVHQRVGGDRPAAKLTQDSPAVVAGARVDHDVPEQVDVEDVRRKPPQLPDPVGEPLHAADPSAATLAGWDQPLGPGGAGHPIRRERAGRASRRGSKAAAPRYAASSPLSARKAAFVSAWSPWPATLWKTAQPAAAASSGTAAAAGARAPPRAHGQQHALS